jgi:Tetratricopeptide repeat.
VGTLGLTVESKALGGKLHNFHKFPLLLALLGFTLQAHYPGWTIESNDAAITSTDIRIDKNDTTQVKLLEKIQSLVDSGERGIPLASAYAKLGLTLVKTGQNESAERCLTNCLTISRREPGLNDRNKIMALTYLSDLFRHCARYEEARKLSQEASRDAQKAIEQSADKDSRILRETLAICLNKESLIEDGGWKLPKGRSKSQTVDGSLSKIERIEGPRLRGSQPGSGRQSAPRGSLQRSFADINAVQVLAKTDDNNAHYARENATARNNLGALYFWLGDYPKAEKLLQDGYQMRLKKLGEYSDEVANSLGDLGCVYQKTGRMQRAEKAYQEALTIRKKLLGAHRETAIVLGNLGNLASEQGQWEKARDYYQEALDMLLQRGLDGHPETAEYQEGLGLVLAHEKHYQESIKTLHDSLTIRLRCLGKNNPDTAKSIIALSKVLTWRENDKKDKTQRDYTEAKRYMSEGKQILAHTLGVNHGDYKKVEKFEEQQKGQE